MNTVRKGSIENDLFNSKNFADLRIKLGRSKHKGDHGKSVNPVRGVEDLESIPSEVGEDQWAEIHNYDYELYQEQRRKEKEDYMRKQMLVRKTLDD